MRSASRSVQFLGTQGVTAEEEVPRWYLIWQTLCCDSDYSEVYAHPFSHLPLATEEWTEENRGTLGVSTFKDQQHQGWCSCPPDDEVWCLKAVISPAICWHYHLTLLTSWWVGKTECSGVSGKKVATVCSWVARDFIMLHSVFYTYIYTHICICNHVWTEWPPSQSYSILSETSWSSQAVAWLMTQREGAKKANAIRTQAQHAANK